MMDTTKPIVLIGTDFTPASQAAFDQGVQLAREMAGQVVLVHALKPLGAPGLELSRPDATFAENETAEPVAQHEVTGAALVASARAQGIQARIVVRSGLPAAVIVEEAERVDAHTVVLGSHGKTGIERVILGSVADEVRKGTTRPVVVVPGVPGHNL